MRGALKAQERQRNLALFGAWWGERLHREEQLKGYRHYEDMLKEPAPQTPQDQIAMFKAMQAGGVGLKITRLRPTRQRDSTATVHPR